MTVALAAIRMADAEVHLRIAHRRIPRPSGRPSWMPPPTAALAGSTTWRRCTGTYGPRTSGPRRSTWASGSASAACGRSYRAALLASSPTPTGRASSCSACQDEAVPAGEIATLDRAGRAAWPGAWRQRAGCHACELATTSPGCSGTCWPDRLASRLPRQSSGASGARARSSRCSRARCTTARQLLELEHPAGSRRRRSSRSPGSPMSCTSPRASRGCTTRTRCRSRSRRACG